MAALYRVIIKELYMINFANSWNIDTILDFARKNIIAVSAGLALLVISVGGWYTYRYFDLQKEEAAHTILVDCLAQYEEAAQGRSAWSNVNAMCQAGYEKYRATKIAPYIVAIQVDALLADQKQQEALEKLDVMLTHLSTSSPLYNLYAMKHALLRLDMNDAALKEKGLADLEKLALDNSNIYNDAAQFYLGLYYREQGEQAKATETWKKLIALNDTISDDQGKSPWAALAQEKINGLA